MGALGGALGGASGALGSMLGNSLGNSLGYNLLSQTTNTIVTNAVFGNNISLTDIVGIGLGAAAGSLLPQFKPLKTKSFLNTLAETGYNSARGAATGAIKGSANALIKGDARYIYQDAIGGAISGGVRTLLNNAIFGAPVETVDVDGMKGIARSGGIANIFNDTKRLYLGEGLTLGRNMYVHDLSWLQHEAHHIYQQLYNADGWADFYWRIACEYWEYGLDGNNHPKGTYEYDAYNP